MTNVFNIFTGKPMGGCVTSASMVKNRPRHYTPMPARITANARLNRRIMELQDDGFEAHNHDGNVLFTHPSLYHPMTFSEACEYQIRLSQAQA